MNAAVEVQGTGPSLVGGGSQPSASRVGIIGTYGQGNLGDEAVFVSFVQWVAENAPHIVPVALCVNPAYIEKTYGVAAYPVALRYAGRVRRAENGGRGSVPAGARPQHTNSPTATRRLIGRLRDFAVDSVPGFARVLRPPWRLVKGFLVAARFLPRQVRVARALDGVIVLGGGQIHDFWDGPYGHPMALFSWALASRMAGKPFGLLSIGAIELIHGMSRRLIRATIRLSAYATVRDRGSAARVASLARSRLCPIYPDLAWGLDLTRFAGRPASTSGPPQRASPRNGAPQIIGVCPMAYRHPTLWASREADADGYARYVGAMAEFCNRLLSQGYEVVLFPTQIRMDVAAVRDVLEKIPAELAHRARLWPVGGIAELVECLASVDVVVSSRFHGVLLSLCAGRPVLSLAYQRKCNELLEALGEGRFGLDIHDFSAQQLWERFEELRGEFGAYAARLHAHVTENRRKLDAQYRDYFARLS